MLFVSRTKRYLSHRSQLLQIITNTAKEQNERDCCSNSFTSDFSESGQKIKVILKIASNETRITMDTDESYSLEIKDLGKAVEIKAQTYFGARHGLETLSQLISYDELRQKLQMHTKAMVEDQPAYIHRGLLIDTSRNFFRF